MHNKRRQLTICKWKQNIVLKCLYKVNQITDDCENYYNISTDHIKKLGKKRTEKVLKYERIDLSKIINTKRR